MKYGYSLPEAWSVIEKYEIVDDKIVVSCLNGVTFTLDNTKENEQKTQEIMLTQARERDKNVDLAKENKTKNKYLILASCVSAVTFNFLSSTMLVGGVAGAFGYSYFLGKLFNQKLKLAEYEKYRIYLEDKDTIDEMDKSEMSKVIKKEKQELNINTLDSYSLEELTKIRDNLRKDAKPKTLIKKIVK